MTDEKKRRAILADDETHIRMMMRVVLQQVGLDIVAEAVNGQEAVELFNKHQPDLLVMDINMPVMNGDEALARIKADHPDATVVMLTSVADMNTVTRCIAGGAAHYILKDNPVDKMKDILREVLQGMQNRG